MSAATEPPRDGSAEAVLARYRAYAGVLLLLAAATWIASHYVPLAPVPMGYVRAAAEAAMVGGIADWFAVTALFRHPLGIPIPHTRLIPRNQARIAEGVARYIDNEFLRQEVLAARLRRFDIAERLGQLLDSDSTRGKLVDGLMRILPRLLDERTDPGVMEAVASAIRTGLAGTDMRSAVARLARHAMEHADFETLVDDLLGQAHGWLEGNREDIRDRIGARTYWFVPRFIDRQIADKMIASLVEMLRALEDRGSPERDELRRWLRTLPSGIERSEGALQRLPEFLRRVVDRDGTSHIFADVLTDLKDSLLIDLKAPDSQIRRSLDAVARALAEQLDSVSLRQEVNAAVEGFLTENVPAWREEVRGFIAETLNRQEPEAFARRIELQVGRDLQFIRINGTIFGALVGGGIHFVNRLLGGG
ncbi:MAG: DUF445 domain-containing protein [Alphaproteobacteria bacterium]|nr:DUF445 domain-containing protein [Alphaproteobacteria bacterium]